MNVYTPVYAGITSLFNFSHYRSLKLSEVLGAVKRCQGLLGQNSDQIPV